MPNDRRSWWTPERRAAFGLVVKDRWAAGQFAARRKPRHRHAWSAAEDAVLRRDTGRLTMAELTTAVAAVGMERTEVAVRLRAKRLGLSSAIYSGLTARQVGALFGVDPKTVTHAWVARGWLSGIRSSDLAGASWVFRAEHLERFIRGYGYAFDWRLMRGGRWRSLAETLDRADPWLTAQQAAAALHIKTGTLLDHCARGWLRSERRFEKCGAQSGRFMLRRSWLKEFRYRRADLVGISGKRSAA